MHVNQDLSSNCSDMMGAKLVLNNTWINVYTFIIIHGMAFLVEGVVHVYYPLAKVHTKFFFCLCTSIFSRH